MLITKRAVVQKLRECRKENRILNRMMSSTNESIVDLEGKEAEARANLLNKSQEYLKREEIWLQRVVTAETELMVLRTYVNSLAQQASEDGE